MGSLDGRLRRLEDVAHGTGRRDHSPAVASVPQDLDAQIEAALAKLPPAQAEAIIAAVWREARRREGRWEMWAGGSTVSSRP
jgi:DNA-directed RNA polymerase specialized sigma24 family protein